MHPDQSFEPLPAAEGGPSTVTRHDDTILRPVQPWTPTIHALLRHLAAVGFTGCPRVVGDGYDGHGNEVLTYVEGELVHPHAWSDDAVWQVGQLLRGLHHATASFQPPADAVWQPWYFHSNAAGSIIGHCDTGPWHIVARDGLPVAFIDWTLAGPIDRRDEIAATAWWNAQLHDNDIAEPNHLPDAAARAAQLRHFLDGYELPAAERSGLVTHMIEFAIRDRVRGDQGTGHARIHRRHTRVGTRLARPRRRVDAPSPNDARTSHRGLTTPQPNSPRS